MIKYTDKDHFVSERCKICGRLMKYTESRIVTKMKDDSGVTHVWYTHEACEKQKEVLNRKF